jgi:protein gp37
VAENSKIEWTNHTFNPWIGCQEMSAACDFCYARVMNERWGWVDGWGPHGERKRTSAGNWLKPIQWDKTAKKAGARSRVFCASLADVFDNQVPTRWRDDLWHRIDQTPHLDWLLLTKRPQNIRKMLPDPASGVRGWGDGWHNVWLGTTAEDQKHFDLRWHELRQTPAAVHFISYEPALGPLTLDGWKPYYPDWIICGGESGSTPRHMEPAWAASLRDECAERGVAFFMKQMTGKKPVPPELMVRQFPKPRLVQLAA